MRILIATDGSEYSEYAVKEFCRIYPNLTGLQILVLSVYEEQFVAAEPFSVPAEYYQQMADASEKQSGHFAASAAVIVRGCKSDGDLT